MIYRMWLNIDIVGVDTYYQDVDVPDNLSDKEVDRYLREAMNEFVYNELDTGWMPLSEFEDDGDD